jgi:hypothetical protein
LLVQKLRSIFTREDMVRVKAGGSTKKRNIARTGLDYRGGLDPACGQLLA